MFVTKNEIVEFQEKQQNRRNKFKFNEYIIVFFCLFLLFNKYVSGYINGISDCMI